MRVTQHGSSRLAVGLYRVSTAKKGQSGLGLEAQQTSVRGFVAGQGWTLAAEFSDIASGEDDRRPGFQAALARCRQLGAVLVAARLDRINRRAHTLSQLLEDGMAIRAAGMPGADELMLRILRHQNIHLPQLGHSLLRPVLLARHLRSSFPQSHTSGRTTSVGEDHKRFRYGSHDQLRRHLDAFVAACNFAPIEATARPHTLQVHLQIMGRNARTLHRKPAPPNAETKHLWDPILKGAL
jgi:hypothetical protein